MNRQLDLSFNGRLPRELCSAFDDIAYSRRGAFNEMVSALSVPNREDLDWWVQGPASRNTFASPFFHYYCCLHFIRHLIDRGEFRFRRVIVDSSIMRRLVERLVRDAGIRHCGIHVTLNARLIRIKHEYLATPVLFVRRLVQYFLARSTRKSAANATPVMPVVLIDTFVTPAYVNDDRWYGALWANLTDAMKRETFFVPTMVMTPLKSMRIVYGSLRAGARNCLVKDDYLKMEDIVFAFQHKGRIRNLSITPFSVLGYDVSDLVREELTTNRDVLTTAESILTYRFIKRLSQADVKVRLSIDWFEGQVIDKAWNLGVKHYYPDAKRVAYRAFESFPFYLCSYPTPIERDAGVIADVIAVQGRGTISTVREFLPDLDVMVIPSFKSQHVWQCDLSTPRDNTIFTVLVALPISIQVSVRIVERLIEAHRSAELMHKPIRYVVKPHPASAANIASRLLSKIPEAFTLSQETSFLRLLAEANLLITEASSTCLEALACGVPVIIMGNDEGLTYDPVPNAVPEYLYRKIRTNPELVEAIKYYKNMPPEVSARQRMDAAKIREEYFEPITMSAIERFMDVVHH
jgi:hypothetical protein